MERHEQDELRKHRSVLDDKNDISGLPSKKKSSVERARADKSAGSDCDSVLDGPACIDGVSDDQ